MMQHDDDAFVSAVDCLLSMHGIESSTDVQSSMGKSKKKASPSQSKGGFISPFVVAILLVIVAIAIQNVPALEQSLTGPRAATKPFKTWNDFYPHYLSEHANIDNRRLHFAGTTIFLLIALWHTSIFTSIGAALLTGFILCPLTAGLEHGLVEGVAMLVIGLLTQYLTTRKLRPFLFVLLIGYGFAWVGHFMFENNRPATFIYPAYSLLSDFKQWIQIVTRELPLELEIGGYKF